jgi:hypothetical protein
LKFKMNVFPSSKLVQTLHWAIFECYEQLCQLSQLQIPTRVHVINFGTNSNLNFP